MATPDGSRRIAKIRIGKHSFSYERGDTARIAGALQLAKEASMPVLCECSDPSPKLVIQSRADRGRWWPATWPKGGPAHALECLFHHPALADAEDRAARLAAIQILPSGFRIKSNISFSRPLARGEQPSNLDGRAGRSNAASSSSTTLLGALEFLMERAQLHLHIPGPKRGWGQVVELLRASLKGGLLGRKRLPEVIYVVPEFIFPHREHEKQFQAFWEPLVRNAQGRGTVPRFLLLCEFKGVEPGADGPLRASVGQLSGGIYLSDYLKDKLEQKYAIALAQPIPSKSAHVLGLFLAEVMDSGKLLAVDGALVLTSGSFVPCDSGHEVRMATLLARKARHFEKPMRPPYPNSDMIPDFLLLDTRPVRPIEVWGMNTPDYLARKQAKRAEYQALGMQLLEWEAYRGHRLPVLPEVDEPGLNLPLTKVKG